MIDSPLISAYRHWRRETSGLYPRPLIRPAADALARARDDVANGRTRYAYPVRSEYGRAVEKGATYDAPTRYAESPGDLGLRLVGSAYDVARANGSRRVEHDGWFIDALDQGDTYAGVVLQLPGRDGRPRFMAAYLESCNGGYVVDFSRSAVTIGEPGDHWSTEPAQQSDALDVAGMADQFAEQAAEKERDYSTAWAAGSQWADRGEEIAAARKEALQILAERRKVKGVEAPALCAAIRSKVESLIEAIQEAREEREKLASGDAEELSFWTGDRNLISAFNEGAGKPVLA